METNNVFCYQFNLFLPKTDGCQQIKVSYGDINDFITPTRGVWDNNVIVLLGKYQAFGGWGFFRIVLW